MNKSVIYIKNDTVIYKDSEYHYEALIKSMKLQDKRLLFILDQQLYTKKMCFKKNQSINDLILNGFGENKDYLFHYDLVNKKREVIVYAIKGGNIVSILCEGAKKVKVIPIQIYIINNIIKKVKDRAFRVIFQVRNSYYYIEFKDNYIHSSYIEKDINNLIERIDENSFFGNIFIDSDINLENLRNNSFKNINVREFLNEKRIWKQRFFTL